MGCGGPLERSDAERAIESLRTGIPPAGLLRRFTVGRDGEMGRLQETLQRRTSERGSSLLIQANYGAGKTHLLRVMREIALEEGFAVAMVTVDSKSGIRFNRMDQVAAAVMRALEVDGTTMPGVTALFDAFGDLDVSLLAGRHRRCWEGITAGGRWDISDEMRSAALWVALRAWIHAATDDVRETVRDWLSFPWEYENSRKGLYRTLIERLPRGARDPRSDRSIYADGVFDLRRGGHVQAWGALEDLDLLCQIVGRRGLVLIFDEFEDVIQNMGNIKYETDAFLNLFRFFAGERFPGVSYFAVTPDFAEKCRHRVFERMYFEFPVDRFDELERFEVSPITRDDFFCLAKAIRCAHGVAYMWDAEGGLGDEELAALVDQWFKRGSADQIRQGIQAVVAALDAALDQ